MSNTKSCSLSSLKAELESGRRKLSLRETPHTMEQGIIRLTDCCNNGGCKFSTEMLAGVHSLSKPLNHAISSDRNTLSNAAIKLVNALLAGLGPSFVPLVSLFVPSLLGLCARTSKVFTGPAKDCIFAIIKGTRSSFLLPFLAESLNHKSASVRSVAVEGVLAYLSCLNPSEFVNDKCVRLLEDVIKLAIRDANASVRQTGKMIFEAYKNILPDNVESFISPLSPITKKYLTMRATAVAQSTIRVVSRGHPMTSIHTQKITSGKVLDRPTHSLSLERTRDVHTVKPIAESNPATPARQGRLRPSGLPKEVARVSTAKRSQRACNMKPRDAEPCVRGGTQRAPAPLLKTNCAEKTKSIRKTSSLVKPILVSSPLTLDPKAVAEAGLLSIGKPGAGNSTPVGDVNSLVFDATTLPHNVNIPDSKVPKKSPSFIQNGYLNTPSHVWRDVSRPVDRIQRVPRRLRRVSTCMERSRNSIAATPLSCSRPVRPLLSCIQSGLPLSSPTQDVIVPRNVNPSCTDVDSKGESLWRARGAAFSVFKDPEPEVVSPNAAIQECSLFMTGDLRAASQLPLGSPSATTARHSDGPQAAVRSSLHPPSTTTIRHSRRQHEVPRVWCRGRRPSEFKFLPMSPLSPAKEVIPISVTTTVDHLRQVTDFLDIAIEDIML